MRPSPHQTHLTRRLAGASVAALLTSIAGLIFVASASATYEQVATFAAGPENQQMRQSTGIAVNTTGAGGVPAGTVYAVSRLGSRLMRYSPTGELRAEWGWGLVEGKNEYQRCGPDGDAAYPECGTVEKTGFPGEGRGQLSEPWGVAVDQSTGNVYVLNAQRQKEAIQVFSADGSQVIAGFGEQAKHTTFPEPAESIEEGPGKFHRLSVNRQGIAVDDTGRVYVSDTDFPESNPPHHRRIMTFDPASPGDYEHYVYRGRSSDINIVDEPQQLAMDSANNLYAAGSAGIYEFSRTNPASPICKFPEPASGIVSMTVDPKTGEVFYFSYKNEEIHQLSACNSEGKFVEAGAFATSPDTPQIYALASNPYLSYSGTRPPGVLYAGIYEIFEKTSGLTHGRGYIFAQPEENPPVVESESVSAVGSTTATAEAKINPKGNPTRYSFQYITEAAYEENEAGDRFAGASEAPPGGAPLGTGQKVLSAAVALRELQPDTVYHYRAVAISNCSPLDEEKACEGVGADQTFRTFPAESSGLPDGRAYELVSPIQKDGGEAFPLFPDRASCGDECKPGKLGDRFPMESSPDGEAVVYTGFPFSYSEGAAIFNEYLSKRTSSGWQTTILSPLLQSNGENQGYRAFDEQLTTGLLYQRRPSLSPEAPNEVANLYTQSTSDTSNLRPLLHSEPPNRTSDLGLGYAGSSADLSHVFFEANDALTEETAFAPPSVDWGVNGANLYESVNGELRLVNVLPGNTETVSGATFGSGRFDANSAVNVSHVVSSDGSRVFWSTKSGQVYLRENGETTREISDHGGKFLTASADGSKLLLSDGHLIDLNEEGTEETVDLTQGRGNFRGILGQSEDLSTVYFVDPLALAPGAEDLKCQGSHEETKEEQEGKIPPGEGCNLYAWHDGETTFVTKLRSADNSPGGGDWLASPVERTAEASPDGRWVAFISSALRPGINNLGPCIRQNGKDNLGPCDEVLLYDSSTGALTCASCNQSGQAPLGNSSLPQIVRSPGSLRQPRYLTDSGRLYFDSRDSLTPFDTNDGVEDVYQYEPGGVGTCKRGGGCINLISAGHEPIDSNFLSTDLTGKSVFFTSRDQLVLKDHDDLIDVYDAREGGGFPAETEASRSECQGEACQPVVVPPNDPTPASSSFEGAGNVDEKKAAKKHKKAHKKKHAKKKHAHKRAAKNNRGGAK